MARVMSEGSGTRYATGALLIQYGPSWEVVQVASSSKAAILQQNRARDSYNHSTSIVAAAT